jgi:SNF2 family DNA or RNA helicase
LKPRKFDIIITNYEGAKICIGPLSRIKWETMIVDEAHKLKNFESQNFQCLNYLKTGFRLLLTGTPLNNNLKELWTLLNFIMPDLFHEADMFERIEEGIKFFEGSEEDRLKYQCRVAKCFHDIINPFFKRRIKKELELGLPDKTELTIFVPLSKLQLRMYRNFLRFGNVFGDAPPANYNIMIPRKLCQHPYLFPGVEEGEGLIADSGKLCVMDKLVTKLIDEKHKILIFSQFVIVLDVLAKYCRMKGYRYSRIDGSDTLDQRDTAVKNFYDKPEFSIFLLSTRAGGLGLNLVAADRVILYDIDWNPQNDLQAMDRAYRIGQTRPVTVYRLVTEKTIEERMLDLQKYKLVWDELVIQKGLVFNRGKEDPFSNINFNDFSRLGKGDIVHLEPGRQDQTIEEILSLGVEKNKQKEAEIRERLKQQINEGQKISLF